MHTKFNGMVIKHGSFTYAISKPHRESEHDTYEMVNIKDKGEYYSHYRVENIISLVERSNYKILKMSGKTICDKCNPQPTLSL